MTSGHEPIIAGHDATEVALDDPGDGVPIASLRTGLTDRLEAIASPDCWDDIILVAVTLVEHAYMHTQGLRRLRLDDTHPKTLIVEVETGDCASNTPSLDDIDSTAKEIMRHICSSYGILVVSDYTLFWADIPIKRPSDG